MRMDDTTFHGYVDRIADATGKTMIAVEIRHAMETEVARATKEIEELEELVEEERTSHCETIVAMRHSSTTTRDLLSEAMTALHHIYLKMGKPEGMRPLIDKIDSELRKP